MLLYLGVEGLVRLASVGVAVISNSHLGVDAAAQDDFHQVDVPQGKTSASI